MPDRLPTCSFDDMTKNLEILAEECAEVIQIKSKIVRFGMEDYYPARGLSNRAALVQELGDVLAMIDVLIENGVVTEQGLHYAKQAKLAKLKEWY